MDEVKNTFNELYKVNVNEFVEKKDTGRTKLSYLSWTYAWKEIKSRFPEASYEVVKFDNGLPYCYDPNTGYMVYTRVTIEGITHEMWLPVMDSHNDAMLAQPYEVKTKYSSYTVQKCTMFDVNKTIMRCLTKNLAMFGLGLYIYAGEDLPNDDNTPPSDRKQNKSNGNNSQGGAQIQKPNGNQPQYPETDDAKKLKDALIDYINGGVIKENDGTETYYWAQTYMGNNDVGGMKNLLAWCRKQPQSA